jgi:hypothetical protein
MEVNTHSNPISSPFHQSNRSYIYTRADSIVDPIVTRYMAKLTRINGSQVHTELDKYIQHNLMWSQCDLFLGWPVHMWTKQFVCGPKFVAMVLNQWHFEKTLTYE